MITLDCWESLCFDQKCFWKVVVGNFSLQLFLTPCACRGNNKETGTAGPECVSGTFRDRSPRYMMRKQNQQKYPIIVNYHPRKIPVRRVPGTSDPCPESHRRMGFPCWEQLSPPLNIVLTLQPGGITGDHRFPVTVTTIGMMITVAPLRSAGTNWGRWSRCRHVRDSPCRTGCSHCLEESSCQRCFF